MADDAGTLVSNQFSLLQEYASSAFSTAKSLISDLSQDFSINMNPPDIEIDSSQSIEIDAQIAQEIPDSPDASLYPKVPIEPSMSDYSFPSAPAYSLPTTPTLTDIVVPEFIDGTITPITSTMPVITFDVPTSPTIDTGSQAPEDSLMQATKAKLESNILNGGTMLDPTVEDDIWNRDLERHEQALQDAIDKLTSQWAKLGFSMPDGLLAGSIIAVNNEYANKRLDRSREIAIKQAELEQQGMFKSLELAIGLEQLVIGSFNEYAKRVFEASKATADVTIEIYKQRVVQFNVMLEAYKTDVTVYKTQIEAEMVRAEAYKARMIGVQTLANIDESRVKLYATHIEAINQLVNVYKTEIQAVGLMYEAEKTKIERFKTQVDAYTAQVDAITKKYASEVEAFKAYVQGYAASADAHVKLTDIDVRAGIAEVEATIKEWEIQLQIQHETNSLQIEGLKAAASAASNLAAGALSAAHASASTGYSSGYQTSINHNYSY